MRPYVFQFSSSLRINHQPHTFADVEAAVLAFGGGLEKLVVGHSREMLVESASREAWVLPRLQRIESWPGLPPLLSAPELRHAIHDARDFHDAYPPDAKAATRFPRLQSLMVSGDFSDLLCVRHWRSVEELRVPVWGDRDLNFVLRSLPQLRYFSCWAAGGQSQERRDQAEAIHKTLPAQTVVLPHLSTLHLTSMSTAAAFDFLSLPALCTLSLSVSVPKLLASWKTALPKLCRVAPCLASLRLMVAIWDSKGLAVLAEGARLLVFVLVHQLA